jgi:hypothetical protein
LFDRDCSLFTGSSTFVYVLEHHQKNIGFNALVAMMADRQHAGRIDTAEHDAVG